MPGTRLELVTRGFSVRLQYNYLSIFTVYAYPLPPFYPQSLLEQKLLLHRSSGLNISASENHDILPRSIKLWTRPLF